MKRSDCWVMLLVGVLFAAAPLGQADEKKAPYNPNSKINFVDGEGAAWDLVMSGQVTYGGERQTFQTAFQLTINGTNFRTPVQRAYYLFRRNGQSVHHKLGGQGIEIGPINAPQGGQLWVTRRIEQLASGWIRFVTIFHNRGAAATSVTFHGDHGFQTSIGQPVRHQQRSAFGNGVVAYCVPQLNGRRSLLQVISSDAKTKISFTRRSTNYIRVNWPALKIPAGKMRAVVSFARQIRNAADAKKKLQGFSKFKALAGLPSKIRRLLTNFKGGSSLAGLDILTDPTADLVVLDDARSLRGTLDLGPLTIRATNRTIKVAQSQLWGVGMSGIPGSFRFGFKDGQIVVGEIDSDQLTLELLGGQVLKIPWGRVRSLAFKGAKLQAPPADAMVVHLMRGDRLIVKALAKPLMVQTRLGRLTLKLGEVGRLQMIEQDNWGHRLVLASGSRLGCLVLNKQVEMVLISGKTVIYPLTSLLAFSPARSAASEIREPGEYEFELRNGDRLVCRVKARTCELDSEFGRLKINWRQVKQLRLRGKRREATILLFDGNQLQGFLGKPEIQVLVGSHTLLLPLDLIDRAIQPQQGLPAGLRQTVLDLIKALDAPAFKVRERAQKSLVALGPGVRPYLEKTLAVGKLSAEQKLRLEQTLKSLDKK